tara:strand:- start:12325 stop:13398 length:1074 start_codon:yes stop_codon:yes gene_type:complete
MFNKRSSRYDLVPQMKIYDGIGETWKPYIMYLSKPNFRSKVVNIDQFGLRFNGLENEQVKEIEKNNTIFNEKIISKNKEKAVLIGNSISFGVGATSDSSTASSNLSKLSKFHFFNLGGRAFSGFQEIVLFQSLINSLKDIKRIVIFSGSNDLFLINHLSSYDPVLGPYYFNNEFIKGMSLARNNWKRNFASFLFDPFIKENVDWSSITKKELINRIFKNKNSGKNPIDKKNILRNLVEKNFKCWSNIQKGMGVKITYVLQPFALFCNKKLSNEEEKIFQELDTTNKGFKTIKSLDKTQYQFYRDCIAEQCNYLNIDFIDGTDFIDKKNCDKEWLFTDRFHLTDLGYKYISELILSKL